VPKAIKRIALLKNSTPIQFRFIEEERFMNREIQLPPFTSKDFKIPYGDPLFRPEKRIPDDVEIPL